MVESEALVGSDAIAPDLVRLHSFLVNFEGPRELTVIIVACCLAVLNECLKRVEKEGTVNGLYVQSVQ